MGYETCGFPGGEPALTPQEAGRVGVYLITNRLVREPRLGDLLKFYDLDGRERIGRVTMTELLGFRQRITVRSEGVDYVLKVVRG